VVIGLWLTRQLELGEARRWACGVFLMLGAYMGLAWTFGLTTAGIDFTFAIHWLPGRLHEQFWWVIAIVMVFKCMAHITLMVVAVQRLFGPRAEDIANAADHRVRAVKTFTEKPQLELAEQFIASGDFYWNSGIFIWSLKNITEAFENHLPEMQELFVEHANAFKTPGEKEAIASIYGDCENISIDYGIMEKAPNVAVVLSDFGWSDLGTWGSLHEKLPLDESGNGTAGVDLMSHESTGNVIVSNSPSDSGRKTIAVRGLNNYIIVDTADSLLICPKSDEQWVKQLVTSLKAKKPKD
jgi:hypothetical protein